MKRYLLIPILMIVAMATAAKPLLAKADDRDDRINAALLDHDQVLDTFTNLDLREKTQWATNFMVLSTVFALEYYGYPDDAKKMLKEWKEQHFDTYYMDMLTFDLGDHDPLSAWFGDQYKMLRLRFGDMAVGMMHLDDINTLNYAIPVAFAPRGNAKTGETWDKLEYSLHFVPLATVVTYWGSYAGCYYATKEQPAIRRFCKQIAGLLRTGMRNWVAPKLSDYVYDKAHGLNPKLDIDRYMLDQEYRNEMGQIH